MSDSGELKLTVMIEPEDVKLLSEAGYNLCLTRNVKYAGMEKQGNVVFSSVPPQRLAPNISFAWLERYQAYGLSDFRVDARVVTKTMKSPVENDQILTLTQDGKAKISGPLQPGAPFRVKNEWKNPAFIGVDNFDPTTGEFHSIFVSPEIAINSIIEITPIKKFSVFWDLQSRIDTLIDPGRILTNNYFTVDLTDKNEVTLEYKNRHWSIVS